MRARTILTLCCFVALLMVGAVLSAEPVPSPPSPIMAALAAPDTAGPAPVCAAAKPALNGPTTAAACPADVWQACYRRYGTCMVCFCLSSGCECENKCV